MVLEFDEEITLPEHVLVGIGEALGVLVAIVEERFLDDRGKVLDKYPSNYDALYGSGACYLRLQDAEKSVRLFRAALQADPSSVAAKMALGEALLSTGKAAEALPLLEGVAAFDPKLRRLQFLLARAYKETGRDADAKRAQDRYRELAAQEEEETGNPESTP